MVHFYGKHQLACARSCSQSLSNQVLIILLMSGLLPCTKDFFNWPNFPWFRVQNSQFYSWIRGLECTKHTFLVLSNYHTGSGDSRRGFFYLQRATVSQWGGGGGLTRLSCRSFLCVGDQNKDGGCPHFSGTPHSSGLQEEK